MDDIHTDAGPAQAVSHLSESLAQAAQSHHAFVAEIATFTKDESLRFVNLRMDRNSQALEKLQTAQGLPGLIGVQQEWLRDLFTDYAAFGQRNASALRGVAQTVAAKTTEAAGDMADRMHVDAQDGMRQGEQMMADTQDRMDTAVQDAGEQAANSAPT